MAVHPKIATRRKKRKKQNKKSKKLKTTCVLNLFPIVSKLPTLLAISLLKVEYEFFKLSRDLSEKNRNCTKKFLKAGMKKMKWEVIWQSYKSFFEFIKHNSKKIYYLSKILEFKNNTKKEMGRYEKTNR